MRLPGRALPLVAASAAVLAVGLAFAAFLKMSGGADGDDRAGSPARFHRQWEAARGCLVGAAPASSDLGEAVAATDLVQGVRCEALLVELRGAIGRGDEWTDAVRVIGDLAVAYGAHRERLLRKADETTGRDELAGAVAAVDRIASSLSRGPSRWTPPPAPTGLRMLETTPLRADGEPVEFVELWRRRVYVRAPDEEWSIVDWPAAGTPRVRAMPSTDIEWSPRGTWSARVIELDDGGTKVVVGSGGMTEVLGTGAYEATMILAAMGDGDERVVVYRTGEVFVARTTDRGRRWTKQALPMGDVALTYAIADDGARIDLVWWDEGARWMSLTAANARGGLPEPLLASDAEQWSECTTGALWLVLDERIEHVVTRVDRAPVGRFRDEPVVDACSAERIVITVGDQQKVCGPLACHDLPVAPRLTGAEGTSGTVVLGMQVLRYAAHPHEPMLAVWRDAEEPRFFRIPERRTLRGVVDGAGAPIAVLTDESNQVELATVP